MLQCFELRANLFRQLIRSFVLFAAAICLAPGAGANTVHVPGDFTTIQAAIDGAPEGATIDIGAGTYYESLLWIGKNLVIRGAGQGRTIIDGGGTSRGLHTSGLGYSSGIEGITFQNCRTDASGGAMLNDSSNLTLFNCAFVLNSANTGGAIANGYGSLNLVGCTFTRNTARYGGGMYSVGTYLNVVNCTFSNNTALAGYGGGAAGDFSYVTVTNSIYWGNSPTGIVQGAGGSLNVTYSDTQDAISGTGNISIDPEFADAANDDVRLITGSPCIDAGSDAAINATGAATDPEGNPRILGAQVDMGALESVPNHAPVADAGSDQSLAASGSITTVTLDGSGSHDPDGDALTYVWTEGAATLATGDKPAVNLSAGTHTLTLTVTDPDGLSSTASVTVSVIYSWSGFLQPINPDGTSIFKAGSVVAVKFRLTGESSGITDVAARLLVALVTNGVVGEVNEAVSNVSGDAGNTFRYDSGQYVYNWNTRGLAPGRYRLQVDLGDGVPSRTVIVALK